MPVKLPKKIPTALTRRDWEMKKSLALRKARKTGVGEQMDKLKTAFDALDEKAYDLTKQTFKGVEDWNNKRDDVIRGLGAVDHVGTLVRDLRFLASREATVLEKMYKKDVPDSDAKQLNKIAKAAAEFQSEFLTDGMKSAIMEDYAKVLRPHIQDLKNDLKAWAGDVVQAEKDGAEMQKAAAALSEPPTTDQIAALNKMRTDTVALVETKLWQIARDHGRSMIGIIDVVQLHHRSENLDKFRQTSADIGADATKHDATANVNQFLEELGNWHKWGREIYSAVIAI